MQAPVLGILRVQVKWGDSTLNACCVIISAFAMFFVPVCVILCLYARVSMHLCMCIMCVCACFILFAYLLACIIWDST
jgi:putative effector of murein hydrolase LrgA (UPF0299 family)